MEKKVHFDVNNITATVIIENTQLLHNTNHPRNLKGFFFHNGDNGYNSVHTSCLLYSFFFNVFLLLDVFLSIQTYTDCSKLVFANRILQIIFAIKHSKQSLLFC